MAAEPASGNEKETRSAGPRAGGAKACPSGPCREGALLLGVMTVSGRLAYVEPPTHVNEDFVARARAMGRPESRFRFSVPCIEDGCPQWTGEGCAVVDKVIEDEGDRVEAEPPERLPRCGIRPRCRWFAQRGAAACGVCPLVVADTGGYATYRSTLAAED